MSRLNHVSIRTKLYGLLLGYTVVVACMLVFTGYISYTYRINGPIYRKLVDEYELMVETAPPTLFIQGPYVSLQELETSTDPGEIRDLKELYAKRVSMYYKDRDDWLTRLPPGEVRTVIETTAHRPAEEVFRLAREEFIPRIGKGEAATKEASEILRDRIRPVYRQHRAIVEENTARIEAQARQLEDSAAEEARFWFRVTTVLSAVVVVTLGFFGWWLFSKITRATSSLTDRVQEMATGASDLTARVSVESTDELGQLAGGINGMIERIHTIVSKARESSLQLLSVASQIAATARAQEGTVQNLSTSSTEVAASVREISATSQDLAGTMGELNENANQASSLATKGLENLTTMASEMKQLVESTGSVSSKLGVIREKANGIYAVVATITKVADQTNLLSINAAIEAEKAGEYGRGFLVVAREIRRLADQTAVATLDIENLVRLMQDAVSAGVMQMDKFADEVRTSVGRVTSVGQMTGEIIHEVQGLSSRFQLVNDGMKNQAIGAQQINDAMTQITDGARRSAQSVQEFERATGHLRSAVESVNQEIAQFKV